MNHLASLRALGLRNKAIAAALSEMSDRVAPSEQRVQDWLTRLRPTPDWVPRAAVLYLCSRWHEERREIASSALAQCDEKWAALIDPILGEALSVAATVPDDVLPLIRPLIALIRGDVCIRYMVTLPHI